MLKTCNFMKNELLHKYLSLVLTKDAKQLQCSTALHLYLQHSYEHKEEKMLCVGPSVTIKEETFAADGFTAFSLLHESIYVYKIFQYMSSTKVYACEVFQNWLSTKF